jgi:hypothetical protein
MSEGLHIPFKYFYPRNFATVPLATSAPKSILAFVNEAFYVPFGITHSRFCPDSIIVNDQTAKRINS